jgi:hypothetical protein
MFHTAAQDLRRQPESMKLSVALILTASWWGITPNLWAAIPPPPAATPASDWSFSVSPYLWIAGVEIETTLDVSPPTTPPSASRFETKLGGGALLAAQVRYKSVGLWLDFVWVQTDTKSVQPGPAFSAMNLTSDFYHSTAAFSYLLPSAGKFHAEVIAGARFWSVNAEMTATTGVVPGFAAGQDETWVTPVIGVDLGYDLNAKWSLLAKGLVGVFDDNSDGWEAMAAVTYRFGRTWSGSLGYRYLHEEYARQRFTYFTDVQGAVLGVSWRF